MDEALRPAEYRFGPDRRITAATGGLALVAAAVSALAGDPPGRLLFALAALLLLGYAVTDLVLWPRVAVSAAGLELRSASGRDVVPWAQVARVQADARQRHGLRSVTLEVEAGNNLHVFSRRALGTDPERAAALIRGLDPRAPS